MCRIAHVFQHARRSFLGAHLKYSVGTLRSKIAFSCCLQLRLHSSGRIDEDEQEYLPKLIFDLPRRFTRNEKLEVRDELAEALAHIPPASKLVVSCPEELRLKAKIELICERLNDDGLENILIVLREAVDMHDQHPSHELRQILAEDASLAIVLRETFTKRKTLSPNAIYAGTYMALWLLGPGTEQPAKLASALLEELGSFMQCLPASEMGSILRAAATREPPLPGAVHLLESLLLQLNEKTPFGLSEDELITALSALAYFGSHRIDPIIVEDLLVDLIDFWPICNTSTLLVALLRLGQASVLDPRTFREIVKNLGARLPLLSSTDHESFLLLLTLHKSAFDRARTIPHPLYDDSTKLLIKDLALGVSRLIPTAPIEQLVRPLSSLAELSALNRKMLVPLNDRLSSARLFSLSPGAFASLVYAHRLAHGPVAREELRQPFALAFGGLLHRMQPQQIASCIQSLWQYSTKKSRHVFESAYGALARSLETGETLAPAEVASIIQIYPRLRFDDVAVLIRILQAVAPDATQEEAHVARLAANKKQWTPKAHGMLASMSMTQLIDVLEAFGEQGLGRSNTVADAVLARYEANGGRISRRNTARALRALGNLGERPPGIIQILLMELRGWIEADPEAKSMSQRPALIALWSLCALDIASHAEPEIDWLLSFLCRNDQICRVLNVKVKSCLLFASLCAIRHELPDIGMKHLAGLGNVPGLVGESAIGALTDVALPDSHELLDLGHAQMGSEISLDSILGSGIDEVTLSATPGDALQANREDDSLSAWPDPCPELITRSALDDLSLRWHLETRATQDSVSKVKLVIGEVLSVLSIGAILRRAPHPKGALAAEATRLTGGFELRWEAGPYDVDWAHPYLKIGILAIAPKDFVEGVEEAALLARTRLRIQHLARVQGWRLVVLRAESVQEALQPPGEDPILDNYPTIQNRVRRANAAIPVDEGRTIKQLRRGKNLDAMADRLSQQLASQLDVVFPDCVTSLGVQGVTY